MAAATADPDTGRSPASASRRRFFGQGRLGWGTDWRRFRILTVPKLERRFSTRPPLLRIASARHRVRCGLVRTHRWQVFMPDLVRFQHHYKHRVAPERL